MSPLNIYLHRLINATFIDSYSRVDFLNQWAFSIFGTHVHLLFMYETFFLAKVLGTALTSNW